MSVRAEDRVAGVAARVEQFRGKRELLRHQLATTEAAATTAQNEQAGYASAKTLLAQTAAIQRTRLKLLIEPLMSSALKALLGQAAAFRIDYSETQRGIQAELITIDNDGVEGRGTDIHGGGVLDVESLLMRMIYVIRLGLPRVLILDEPLKNVHGVETIRIVNEFLARLCSDLGIQIILITGEEDRDSLAADRLIEIVKTGGKAVARVQE